MPNLAFWDQKFLVAPYFMLALGIYKFIVSIYGFGITGSKNRGLLIIFAIFLGVAFMGQIVSIFLFWEVNTLVRLKNVGAVSANKELRHYGQNGHERITKSWDHMQSHLHCCGAHGANIGYKDYKNTPIGQKDNSVPSSCCRNRPQNSNCGIGILNKHEDNARQDIYTDGCLVILLQWMDKDVHPMIGVYSGVGVAIALVELIALVLVCAYVAQINRKRQREERAEIIWSDVRGDRGELNGLNHNNDKSSDYDTQV